MTGYDCSKCPIDQLCAEYRLVIEESQVRISLDCLLDEAVQHVLVHALGIATAVPKINKVIRKLEAAK